MGRLLRTATTGAFLIVTVLCVLAASIGAQTAQQPKPAPDAPPQQGTAAQPQQPGSPAQPAAQEKRAPRAKSQEELDAYQKFMREQNPDQQIKLIEDFLLKYPQTELKEYAFQAATQAYQAKNDYNKVLTYGELTLGENPNNLVALLVLAAAIPERTAKNDIDKEAKLGDAERYAKRGLEAIEKLPMPANLTEQQWAEVKKDAESNPHAALGMVALIREDFPQAEAELKMATDLESQPDPVTFYRLGLCYSFEKKYQPALEALDRAAASGGVKIAGADGVTRDLVAEAKDFVSKAKAA